MKTWVFNFPRNLLKVTLSLLIIVIFVVTFLVTVLGYYTVVALNKILTWL